MDGSEVCKGGDLSLRCARSTRTRREVFSQDICLFRDLAAVTHQHIRVQIVKCFDQAKMGLLSQVRNAKEMLRSCGADSK